MIVARALVKAQRNLGVDARVVSLYVNSVDAEKTSRESYEISCAIPRKARWTRGIVSLRQVIKKFQPDLIHHHDGIMWPRLACIGLGIPRVSHGHLGACVSNPFSSSWWTHQLAKLTTNHLIAISKWVAQSWTDSGMSESKITLIPNGVDTERFYKRPDSVRSIIRKRYGIMDGETLLVWAGRLDMNTKGLDRLVKLSKDLPCPVRLIIIGDGPDGPWLKNSFLDLALSPPPIFTGLLEDPSDIFGSADAFVLTSRTESFGLVLLEAASSSLPIYAFPCQGGGNELLDELQAYRAADADYSGLADAISHKLGILPSNCQAMIQERYSWKTGSIASLEVYKKVLAASAR